MRKLKINLLVYYFVPSNVFYDSGKKMNNNVLYVGNYKISQKKSSNNVFSGTGASFGGIAQIYVTKEMSGYKMMLISAVSI